MYGGGQMASNNSTRTATKAFPQDGAVFPAVVLACWDGSQVLDVRLLGETEIRAEARLATFVAYRPSVGDRVLVAHGGDEHYVVGVLHAAKQPALGLADGSRAELGTDGALELRDREGRVLIRYADGAAEIHASEGDLTLAAPQGRVVLRSGVDIELDAGRDVLQRVGRKLALTAGTTKQPQLELQPQGVQLNSPRLDLTIQQAQVAVGKATVVARAIETHATSLSQVVERYELTADRLVEKTRDAFRDVTDLLQTRVGRARLLVKDVYAMYSRRTVMVSKQDTSIDGKRILLG